MLTRPTMIRTLALGATLTIVLAAAAQAQMPGGNARAQLQRACGSDVQKLCAGVQPGGGRLLGCLKGQSDKVSDACTAALSTLANR